MRRISQRASRHNLFLIELLDPRYLLSSDISSTAAKVAARSVAVRQGESSGVTIKPVAPAYSSLPGAAKKLYLDFTGDTINHWAGLSPGVLNAFDTDGDSTSFSATERAAIREVWMTVSEIYSPLNLDVTTINPGALTPGQVMRVLFTPTSGWFQNYGAGAGVTASVGAFNTSDNTAFAFTAGFDASVSRMTQEVARVAAHEAGHGFGLEHQAIYDANGTLIDEYSPGTDGEAFIMGSAAYRPERRPQWDLGTIAPTTIQDDLATLAGPANGFGYRVDDFGDTDASATALGTLTSSTPRLEKAGLIENTSDVDVFSFTKSTSSSLAVRVNTNFNGYDYVWAGMLDASLEVFTAAGTLIGEAKTSSWGESLDLGAQPAGTYYVRVSSAGQYGDVGQYHVAVTSTLDVTPPTILATTIGPPLRTVTFRFNEDVGTSLDASDLVISSRSDPTKKWYADTVSWNAATRFATFSLPLLPDDHYAIQLMSGSYADADFNVGTNNVVYFVDLLSGDVNGDGIVNFSDLIILAQNYGQTGKAFRQGNVDGSADGSVNFDDLLILAQHYNTQLPSLSMSDAASSLAVAASVSKTTPQERSTRHEDVASVLG